MDVAKVVTDLGAFATVATLLVGVGILLAARRHFVELGALRDRAVLIYVGVQLTKSGSRPAAAGRSAWSDTEGSSFPSGHAAYATIWVGVAVVAARVLTGLGQQSGAGRPSALAIAAVVGLSRIYLRVALLVRRRGRLGPGRRGARHRAPPLRSSSHHLRHNGRPESRPRTALNLDLTTTELVDRGGRRHRRRAATSRSSSLPAVAAYGRLWEKAAAGFLTLFILATLLGTGAALGLAIVWSYDTLRLTQLCGARTGLRRWATKASPPYNSGCVRGPEAQVVRGSEPVPERLRGGLRGGRVGCRAARGGARGRRTRSTPASWCWTPHSSVLAVACLSPEDERAVLAGEGGTEAIDLRVADERWASCACAPAARRPRAR